jgi:ParB family transcriptional regulator, chromosome partitioning protein
VPPKRASLRDRADQATPPLASVPPAAALAAADPLWGTERGEQAVVDLELREIMPNRRQPRSNPAEAELDELAESIRTHGVIQPVIVRPIPLTKYEGAGRRYELIAGERRWRASAIAGRTTLPALIRQEPADHRVMLELALIENVQRQDLHPLDEAVAFGQLQNELGYSYSEIAARIGKSKAYVTNRMRLLQLDEDLRALVAARPDTIKHVYELARVTDPDLRAPLIAAVRDEDLSRAATKERVDVLLAGTSDAESVSQETERDVLHEAAVPKSVSQETERDILHKSQTVRSFAHRDSEEGDQASYEARLARDLDALGRMLDRWEQQAARDQGESRVALLRIIDELSTRLERLARSFLPPS